MNYKVSIPLWIKEKINDLPLDRSERLRLWNALYDLEDDPLSKCRQYAESGSPWYFGHFFQDIYGHKWHANFVMKHDAEAATLTVLELHCLPERLDDDHQENGPD